MALLPGDRVRALVPFGEPGDEDHVPGGSLGTVVDPPHARPLRARRPIYVAFDEDPTDAPWTCAPGEVERVSRPHLRLLS